MNPDAPFSPNGVHKTIHLKSEKKNVTTMVLAFIAIPLMLLVVFPVVYTIAMATGKPVFNTVEELNLAEVDRFEVRMFNLKESFNPNFVDDKIGPYVAKQEQYEKLITPLRSATAVDDLPVKAILGEYRIQMKDGRKQVIRLSFIAEQDQQKQVAFKIGNQGFRGGSVADLVNIVDSCDPRPRK